MTRHGNSKATWLGLVALGVALAALPAAAAVSGFPDTDPTSGRFVNITRGAVSLGDPEVNFAIEVPAGPSFEVGIFDGNMGGKWDPWAPSTAIPDQVTFTLYADPNRTGSKSVVVASADGATMPDDAWFSAVVPNTPAALSPRGTYMYNLVVSWQAITLASETNNFKLRVEGQIYAPAGGSYGLLAYTPNDPDAVKNSPSTYDGTWHFHLVVPAGASQLVVWDGDFDRFDDVHDLDSPAFPPFPYSPATLAEGAYPGIPADDAPLGSRLLVPPPIYYTITGPGNVWTATDANPSGNQEWERFAISTNPGSGADVTVPSLPSGVYEWTILGADGRNNLFVHADVDAYAQIPGGIGDYVWFDANLDGIQNDGPSSGIANVTVKLWVDTNGDNVADTLVATTTTDANGWYYFGGLLPATYEVRVIASTLPSGVTGTYDPDGLGTANSAKLILQVASTNLTTDFGYGIQRPANAQGCTPGYWKQSQHFDAWVKYRQTDMYNSIFSVSYVKSLLDALGTGGGGEKALGRHAAAALLNSVHPNVAYYYTESEVIRMVQDAYRTGDFEGIKNLLAAENEKSCPLN